MKSETGWRPMRMGRLAIDAERGSARFYVIPDDGGEPIEIRVNRGFLGARMGRVVTATIRCFVGHFDIHDLEGRRAHGSSRDALPVLFPQITVTEDGQPDGLATAVGWRFTADGGYHPLRIERFNLEEGYGAAVKAMGDDASKAGQARQKLRGTMGC